MLLTFSTCFQWRVQLKIVQGQPLVLIMHGQVSNLLLMDQQLIKLALQKEMITRLSLLQYNMVSPFSIHQQQLAMLAQQQSLLVAAAAKSGGVAPKFAGNAQQPGPNDTFLPTQNLPNVGCQFSGMMVPAAGNIELQKYMQQMGKIGSMHPAGSYVPFPMASTYTMGQNVAVNGVAPAGTNRKPSPTPVSSADPTQNEQEYDFSLLTQGMFSKS